jgi:hypothetical protein
VTNTERQWCRQCLENPAMSPDLELLDRREVQAMFGGIHYIYKIYIEEERRPQVKGLELQGKRLNNTDKY